MDLVTAQKQTLSSPSNHLTSDLANAPSPTDIDISASFRQLPATIERLLSQDTASQHWLIIQRRFGFGGVECETLESLGELLGVTRERIRQKEVRAKELIYARLFARARPTAWISASEIATARAIWGAIERCAANREIFTLSETQSAVADCCRVNVEETLPITLLVLDLQRFHVNDLRMPTLSRVCTRCDRPERLRIEKRLRALHDATCDLVAGVDELALIKRANRTLPQDSRMTLQDGQRLLPLLEGILEQLPDGRLRAQFNALRGRGNQVERLFIDENVQTLTVPAMAMKINERLTPFGYEPVSPANLGNQISNDSRFVPIGKSGQWALASQEIETGSIVDLMCQCLHERGKPATSQEIYDYVSARRKVSRNSINIYLGQEAPLRFRKCGPDLWALSTWPSDLFASRDRENIAKIVAAYFNQRHAKKLPWAEVRNALAEALTAPQEDARYLLQHNPVVKTEKLPNGMRFAVIQPDYKERLAQPAKRQLRNNTIMSRMHQRIVEIFNATVGQEMPLAELRLALMKEFPQQSSATVYGYISSCANVEKYQLPGMPMMVRLKEFSAPAHED